MCQGGWRKREAEITVISESRGDGRSLLSFGALSSLIMLSPVEGSSYPCHCLLSVTAILLCKHDKFATPKTQTFTKKCKETSVASSAFCCSGVRFRITQSVLGFTHVTRSAVPGRVIFRKFLSLIFILSVVAEAESGVSPLMSGSEVLVNLNHANAAFPESLHNIFRVFSSAAAG